MSGLCAVSFFAEAIRGGSHLTRTRVQRQGAGIRRDAAWGRGVFCAGERGRKALLGFGGKTQEKLHGARIEDYALIGDLETAALVSREGSIDWLCWPTFSSAACFAALLGTREHGYWKIFPAKDGRFVSRRYRPNTMIVETTVAGPKGEAVLIDFMPPRGEHSDVVRIVRGVRGRVDFRMDLTIRFDFGSRIPWVTDAHHELRAIAGGDMVVLRTEAPMRGEGLSTVSEFSVREGESVPFVLTSASSMGEMPKKVDPEQALKDTEEFWVEWASHNNYRGRYREVVERSVLTLKSLSYRPSGAMVAAPTTSLPEWIGGERNWDYRYCWMRDTAFLLLALTHVGYQEEAVAWRSWLLRAVAGTPAQMQTIYGICGERKIPEWEATWLPGYRNSRPVRVGNAAVSQFQLDVYGEVIAALTRIEIDPETRVDAEGMMKSIVDHLCNVWPEPDDGIWEVRGSRRQFTHSKVMAWVALDRAIKHHEKNGGQGDIARWRKNRDMIHAEVCQKGFNKRLNSFVGSYGSSWLDAAMLRAVLVGFLPPEDPRIIGTVDAIQKRLMERGFVKRYQTDGRDGLKGSEGMFLPCSFWLVINLHLIGREAEARAMYERLLGLMNDVGLLSEEYDPKQREMLGNFPQALTHIAVVHAALALDGGWRPEPGGGSGTR